MKNKLTIPFLILIIVSLFLSFPISAYAGFFNVPNLLSDLQIGENIPEPDETIFKGFPWESCPIGNLCLQVNYYPIESPDPDDFIFCEKDPDDPSDAKVPEPGTVLLLGIGFIASVLIPRKKFNQ